MAAAETKRETAGVLLKVVLYGNELGGSGTVTPLTLFANKRLPRTREYDRCYMTEMLKKKQCMLMFVTNVFRYAVARDFYTVSIYLYVNRLVLPYNAHIKCIITSLCDKRLIL